MKKVEAYVDAQFKKLPHTRTYRDMKKNILLDCKDKYGDYFNLYGDNAEDKIIEEIGTASELYHGGLYLIDWLNLCSIIFIIGYLLFVLFMREAAVEASDREFSVFASVYGIPAYIVLVMPKYTKGILISYVLCNLIFTFKLLDINKLTKRIKDQIIYSCALILWCAFVFLLASFIVNGYFLIAHPLLLKYYVHGPFWQIFDIVYGILLGLCTNYVIEKSKLKRLSSK